MSTRQLASTIRVLRAVLRSAALRRVMFGFLLFVAVQYGSWVAVLLWAYGVLGPASVGIVALAQLIPSGLFAAVAASFAGRYPALRVLVGGYLALAACTLLTAAAMALAWPPVMVVAAGAASVCAMTMTRPAQGGLLPVIARTPEELTAANAIVGSVDGLGMLLGPLVAAAMLAFGPPAAVFAAAAVASMLAVGLVARLPADQGADPDVVFDPGSAPPSIRARLAGGARAMVEDADVRLIIGVLGAQRVMLGALEVLLVLLAMEVLGTGASGAGLMSAAVGLGFVAGGLGAFALVGRRRLTPVIVAGSFLAGGSVLVLGGVTSPATAIVLIAVASLGAATLEVTGRTVLQRVVAGRALTRVLGALEGVQLLAWGVGSIIAPLLVGAIGIAGAVMAVGLILPGAVLTAWLPLRRIDRRVRVPARELALLLEDPLLGPLPAPMLEAVASGARWVTVEAGEVLIREGDRGDRYYVLETGALQITQGGRVIHEDGRRGYGLGEIALLRDVARTATASATAASVLLAVERAAFLQAVTGHEEVRTIAHRTADDRERSGTAGTTDRG